MTNGYQETLPITSDHRQKLAAAFAPASAFLGLGWGRTDDGADYGTVEPRLGSTSCIAIFVRGAAGWLVTNQFEDGAVLGDGPRRFVSEEELAGFFLSGDSAAAA